MGSMDEFLKFVHEGKADVDSGDYPTAPSSALPCPVRPTASGLKWIDTPSSLSNGIAFRLTPSSLELIQVVPSSRAYNEDGVDGDEGSVGHAPRGKDDVNLVARCALEVPGVHVASSSDGRLVAVACIDGSVRIFDACHGSLSARSTISGCHSHVTSNLSQSPSKDRTKGATLSGPVMTLAFNPSSCPSMSSPPIKQQQQQQQQPTTTCYYLLLVDASIGVAIYDAQQSAPQNLLSASTRTLLDNVSCAAWNSSTTQLLRTSSQESSYLLLGRYDGSVELVRLNFLNSSISFGSISNLGKPASTEAGNDYCCTHLNWMEDDTVVAGLCHVIPSEDDGDDDEEDDDADHETCLCTMIICPDVTASSYIPSWENHEDVVPFFSVPKHGRHAFFTSYVNCVPHQLILVAVNVGSDVAVLTREDGSWHLAELPDGAGATTPTDDDDEFMFPMGLATVQLPSAGFRLLLQATDGSTSSFDFVHTNDKHYFAAPIRGGVGPLPAVPVEYATSFSIDDGKNGWEVVAPHEIAVETADQPSTVVEKESTTTESNAGIAFLIGSSSMPALVPELSSTTKPFGSGSVTSLSFGSSSGGGTSTLTAFTPKSGASESESMYGSSPFAAFSSSTAGTTAKSPFAFGAAAAAQKAQEHISDFSVGKETNDSSLSCGKQTPAPGSGTTANEPTSFSFRSTSISNDMENIPLASTCTPSHTEESVIKSVQSSAKDASSSFLEDNGERISLTLHIQPPQEAESVTMERSQQHAVANEDKKEPEVASSSESTEKEERANEESKLRRCFEKLSKTSRAGTCFIKSDQFSDLMGAMEITYDEYVHGKVKTDLISKDGNIYEEDVVRWYLGWLFGEDDGSEDENKQIDLDAERGEGVHVYDSAEAKRASSAFDIFDREKTGTVPVSSLEALIDELGEGFSGDEFDKQVELLDLNRTGMVTKKAFVDWYVDLLNKDDDGGSLDTEEREQRAEEAESAREQFGRISKTDSGDTKGPYVLKEQFRDLIESFGTVYCEEVHTRSLKKLVQPNGRIYEKAFIDWYVDWIFGGDESSVENSDDENEETNEGYAEDSTAVENKDVPSLASIFNQGSSKQWKCDVCSVPNKETSDACIACGTRNPNASVAAPSASAGSGPFLFKTSSAGTNSFSFGAPSSSGGTDALKPTISFGASSSTTQASAGFSFGAPSATSTKPSTSTPSTKGFSFVAPSNTDATTPLQNQSFGFSFGAPSSTAGTTTKSAQNQSGRFPFGTPTSNPSFSGGEENDEKEVSCPKTGLSFGVPSASAGKTTVASFSPVPSAAADFPPTYTKAPTPFSAVTKAPAPSPQPAAAAFPPMSTTAPKPFSALNKVPSATSQASSQPSIGAPTISGGLLSSMSSSVPLTSFGNAPTPFPKSASSFSPIVSTAPSHFPSIQNNSDGATLAPMSACGGQATLALTATQTQLSRPAKQMQVLLHDMEKMSEHAKSMSQKLASSTSTIHPKAEKLVVATGTYRQQLLELDDVAKEMKEQRAFALSRNTDSKRQVTGAKKIIGSIRSSWAASDGAQVNSLDADSEFTRRSIAASTILIGRRIALAKEKIDIIEKMQEGKTNAVSQQVMNLYRFSKAFENSTIPRITSKIQTNHQKGGAPRHTGGKYELIDNDNDGLEINSPKTRHQSRPKLKQLDRSTQSISGWKSIEALLPGLASVECNFNNLQPRHPAQGTLPPPSGFTQEGPSKNLLLSPSPFKPLESERSHYSNVPRASVFSPPSTVRTRTAWGTPSTIEQVQMKKQLTSMPTPTNLREMSLLDTAKASLSGFSTTPERLKAAVDTSAYVPPPKSSSALPQGQVDVTTSQSLSKTPTVARLSNAHEGKIDSKKKQPAPAFPPVSAAAPKNPFSGKAKDDKGRSDASDASSTTKPSQGPLGLGQPAKLSPSAPAPQTPALSSSLEGMGSLGASLFSGLGHSTPGSENGPFSSSSSTPEFSPRPPVQGTSSTEASTMDYKSMLTSFYQKYNQSKVNEVEKTLLKYRGQEKELFAKLAKKYNTLSPLEDNTEATKPAGPAFGISSASTANVPPASPFATSTGSTNASPFSAAGAATNSTPFSSSSPSPFSSTPKPAASAFGTGMVPASSPFGSGSAPSSSPFSGAPSGAGFMAPSAFPGSSADRLFNGKTAREMLTVFYQERDPSKLANVDKLLTKYHGKEEQMFQALAKKNNIPASVFGVSDQPSSSSFSSTLAPPVSSGSGFGQPTVLGAGTGAGGSFGSPSHWFGAAAGGQGFGGASFGSLAAGGGGFGSPGASPFGAAGATPFGAPRR